MYELNIHISPSYKPIIHNIDFNFIIKDNNKINIIEHDNYDNKDKLDLNIRHSCIYSYLYIDSFYNNKVFINTFRDKHLISHIYEYSDDLTIFPYIFTNNHYSKFYIQQHLDQYNKLYNNNKISKSFGNKYWLVKSQDTFNFIDILLLTDTELLNYNNKNIFIQKYLEYPLINNNKKNTIKAHIMIFPKIININDYYHIKYNDINIDYKIYLHKYIMITNTINDYIYNDTSMKNINTMQVIQGFDSNNHKLLEDTHIKNLIIKNLKKLKKNKNFDKIIKKSIYGYPYFGQIISIDFEIDNDKKNIYIDRITGNMGLEYDEFKKSNIFLSFYQKLIKSVFKIKYNKLIKYKNKYTNELILI